MSVASARAVSSHPDSATRQGLERSVAWSRQWSAEFPFCLANHLPMLLVALHRMGASDERLEAYCQIYHEQNGLVPVPDPKAQITRHNWREFLGQREREGGRRRQANRLPGNRLGARILPAPQGAGCTVRVHALHHGGGTWWTTAGTCACHDRTRS